MARIGILSDVHGNRPALDAVFSHAGECDTWWCAGDTVGYGPYPDECALMLEGVGAASVAGNHDLGAIGSISLESFNSLAREACRWTGARLGVEVRAYLDSLPPVLETAPDTVLVHGSYTDPVWEYVLSATRARNNFEAYAHRLCFNGHSHVPVVFTRGPGGDIDTIIPTDGARIALEEDIRYMVNAGSVGQPRDGDPRACYIIYNTDEEVLFYHRVEYPVAETQARIIEEGLPRLLAERIAHGR